MKHLDVILIVIGAAVCLFLLLPFRSRRFAPYWLTYVVPTLLGLLILTAVITNALRANPPSYDQMWRRMEKLGYSPVDVTPQEKETLSYYKGTFHKAISIGEDFDITWYQFSFESNGREQISKLREALDAAGSDYQVDYHNGRYTTRWTATSGDDYYLLIVYNDTLLKIQGTIQQKDAIQDVVDDLGYWE